MANNDVKIVVSAVDKASGTLKQTTSNFSKLSTGFEQLTGFSLGAAAGIGAVGMAMQKGIKFVKDSVNETVNYNKTVREMTQVTGQSADSISRIIQVGDDWGISMEAVRSSMAFMNKQGIEPSIDNIAKLADEYVASTDKAKFAERAVKVLGRGYQTLIPLLALGGRGFKEATAAIDDNMIVTKEAMDASREYEVAVDSLNDTFQGLKYTVGNEVIPILTDLMNFVNDNTSSQKEWRNAMDTVRDAFKKGLITEGEYKKLMHDLQFTTKGGASAMANLAVATGQAKDNIDDFIPSGESAVITIENLSYATGDLTLAQQGALKSNNDYRVAQENLKKVLEDSQPAMDILGGALSTLSDNFVLAEKVTLAFELALGRITQAEYDYQVGILNTLGPLQEMSKMVEDGKLDISYLERAMADGTVTAAELESAYRATGMSAEEARIKVDGLNDSISRMVDKTITLTVIHKDIGAEENYYVPGQVQQPGEPAGLRARGGPVMSGVPYIVGEQGPELFVPSQNGNIVNNNNLTMNIKTNANSSSLVRDFNMMKAMAG